MIRTRGLTHIHLIVRDMKRSRAFYCKVFGMQVSFKVGTKLIFLNTPGSKDAIALHEDSESARVAGKSGGIAHFGFRLKNAKDIKEVKQKITEAGGIISDEGEFLPGSPYVFFKDPDGYEVEVWYELLGPVS